MLTVERLECRYGKVLAVRELSLEVRKGELVSLIGANGAGKTTTLKAISGVLGAKTGRIVFEGVDITRASARRIPRTPQRLPGTRAAAGCARTGA